MDIGLRLKLFRVVADLRQREVAEKLNISVNYVSMLERGRRDPTLKYLQAFAGITGIPLSVLLWDPSEAESREPDVQKMYSRLSALMAEFAGSIGAKD